LRHFYFRQFLSSACVGATLCYVLRMKEEDRTKLSVELLGDRTQDDVLAHLNGSGLTDKEQITLLAELLVLTQQDKDRLKDRLATLLASRFGHSSEKASKDQMVLFAEALRVSPTAATSEPAKTDAGPPAAEPPADGGAGNAEMVVAPKPAPRPDLVALIERTDWEIATLVGAKRAEAQKERERRKRAQQQARAAGETTTDTPWPDHLPVEEVFIFVDELACPDPECGEERARLRFETTWRLEEVHSYKIVVIHREVVACRHHHGAPESPPLPPTIVPKGHLGLALSVRILWLRISQNLPICRIVEMLAADGVAVSEDMIHTLLDHAFRLLEPVLLALLMMVRDSMLVNLDDTTVRILDRKHPKGQRLGRIWLALGEERWAYYFATATWAAEEAEKRLGSVAGVVQGDGYKGHKKNGHKLRWLLAGCMAHLRRKLMCAVVARDPRATEAMALVQALYRVEKLAKVAGLNAQGRLKLRQERSVPLMNALAEWAARVAPTIEEGSPLGKAWTYLKNQWVLLNTFLGHGHVSIDNNAAERGLRRITIGRKLWLFFRGDRTCERAAGIASILMTARLHGANELAYLTWLYGELLRRDWSPEAARKLLPDYWPGPQQEEVKEREPVRRGVG
jgi:transposase